MNQEENDSYVEEISSRRNAEKLKLDKFFDKISDTLNSFAEFHGLQIVKYGCRFPMWELIFRHPKEGIAKIEVRKDSDREVKICPVWWIDERKTRHSFGSEGEVSSLDADKLRGILEAALASIASWDKSILTRKSEISQPNTRGMIKKELEQYQFPKHVNAIDDEKSSQRFREPDRGTSLAKLYGFVPPRE